VAEVEERFAAVIGVSVNAQADGSCCLMASAICRTVHRPFGVAWPKSKWTMAGKVTSGRLGRFSV
jgi:hypothetical protein